MKYFIYKVTESGLEQLSVYGRVIMFTSLLVAANYADAMPCKTTIIARNFNTNPFINS